MARHRAATARYEAPEWYRNFHQEMWDEPDDLELSMTRGCPSCPWPNELHDYHSQRRWAAAKHDYRLANPEFGTQEFNDLMAAIQRRRAGR